MKIFTAFVMVAGVLCAPLAKSQAELSTDLKARLPKVQTQHGGHEHASVSPGKPAAAITLVSESMQPLKRLQSTKLEVVLESHLHDGTIDIAIKVDDPLEFLSLSRQWSFTATDGKRIILPIDIMAKSNGVHYMHIFVHHRSAEGEVTPRAFAVEFSVGVNDMQLFSKNDSTTTNPFPKVVQLPAEEQVF